MYVLAVGLFALPLAPVAGPPVRYPANCLPYVEAEVIARERGEWVATAPNSYAFPFAFREAGVILAAGDMPGREGENYNNLPAGSIVVSGPWKGGRHVFYGIVPDATPAKLRAALAEFRAQWAEESGTSGPIRGTTSQRSSPVYVAPTNYQPANDCPT